MSKSNELIKELCKDFSSSKNLLLPKHRALYEFLRQEILQGSLLPGICLPSSRLFAKQLKLSRNTVINAYEQLCVEGYAIAKDRSGIYILPTAPNHQIKYELSFTKKLTLSKRGEKFVEHSFIPKMRGAFALGVPDLESFPFHLWHRYLAKYFRNPKASWQNNPNEGGLLELREILAEYLRIHRSIQCSANQILITQGTQHSLRLIADLLVDGKEDVWVEEPGYSGAKSAFLASDLNVVAMPLFNQDFYPLKFNLKKAPKLIYITPSHQFPTGTIMNASTRRACISEPAIQSSWIIEDDYDSEFRYEGEPIAALQALAPNRVIYLGTFSKIFFPSIHIGYMVLPEHIYDQFRIVHARQFREPSYIMQQGLADFMRDGHASSYIKKMKREYHSRRDALIALLKSQLKENVQLGDTSTGLHFVIYLPEGVSEIEITKHCNSQGIMVRALSEFYSHPKNNNRSGLILGFGDANQQTIKKAGKKLCEIINRMLG